MLTIFHFTRKIISTLIDELVQFKGDIVYTLLMFFAEFTFGGILTLYQRLTTPVPRPSNFVRATAKDLVVSSE